MTYYNLVFRAGHERFAAELADAGRGGHDPARRAARGARAVARGWRRRTGIETVLLAGPITPDDRLAARVRAVAGVRLRREPAWASPASGPTCPADLGGPGRAAQGRHRPPGRSWASASPARSRRPGRGGRRTASIVASALMRRLLDGGSADDAGAFVATLRKALDQNGS